MGTLLGLFIIAFLIGFFVDRVGGLMGVLGAIGLALPFLVWLNTYTPSVIHDVFEPPECKGPLNISAECRAALAEAEADAANEDLPSTPLIVLVAVAGLGAGAYVDHRRRGGGPLSEP